MNRFDSILALRQLLVVQGCNQHLIVNNPTGAFPAYACDSVTFRDGDSGNITDCDTCTFRNVEQVDKNLEEIGDIYDRLREVNAKETD